MEFLDSGRQVRIWKRRDHLQWILVIFIAVAFIFPCNGSFAAETVSKYQVVNGTDDKAYLVDTTTGFVWVLTHRTITTGREPIAIPYKFITICPKNQKDFLVENVQGGACLPASEGKK